MPTQLVVARELWSHQGIVLTRREGSARFASDFIEISFGEAGTAARKDPVVCMFTCSLYVWLPHDLVASAARFSRPSGRHC
jgi:hypothetical protein